MGCFDEKQKALGSFETRTFMEVHQIFFLKKIKGWRVFFSLFFDKIIFYDIVKKIILLLIKKITIMDAEKRLEMIALNSTEQCELALYDALQQGRIEYFQSLVKAGYAITAFVLNTMIDNGFEDKIEETIENCKMWNDNVLNFLILLWGEEKAKAYWVKHSQKSKLYIQLNLMSFVRNQEWNVLMMCDAYEELALYAPLDVLKTIEKSKKRKKILAVLVAHNRFEDILKLKWQDEYEKFPEILKYLLEHDLKQLCNLCLSEQDYQLLGFNTRDDFYRYLYEHGEKNYLGYQTDYFVRHKMFDELVHYNRYRDLARLERYDLIDWDKFTNVWGIKEVAFYAEKAQNWDYLIKHKYHKALLKHGFLWMFIKSFF